MSSSIPACQFGYLSLTFGSDQVLVKANMILYIYKDVDGDTSIYFADEYFIVVDQTVEQILEKLESIHPSLR